MVGMGVGISVGKGVPVEVGVEMGMDSSGVGVAKDWPPGWKVTFCGG